MTFFVISYVCGNTTEIISKYVFLRKGVGYFETKYNIEELCFQPICAPLISFLYNIASKSFNAKKLSADFYREIISFIRETAKYRFEPPFGGQGNLRASSIPQWNVRDRLSIGDN